MTQAGSPRVGVVGVGLMGLRHATILAQLPRVRLVAVADASAEARARAEARLTVPALPGWADLLALDLDAVVVALPEHLHRDCALAVLGAGHHLLIEKPLAIDPAEADEIAAAATSAQGYPPDRVAMAGHLLRFDPRYALARAAVRTGWLGEVVHITTRRNSAMTGPLRYGRGASLTGHVAVHDLDLIRWFTGQAIVRVTAEARRVRLREHGIDDSLLALLRLSGGAIAAVECAWILPAHLGAASTRASRSWAASAASR